MAIEIYNQITLTGGINIRTANSVTYTTWDSSPTWNNATADPVYSNGDLTVSFPAGTYPNNAGQARSVASFSSGLRYAEVTLVSRVSASFNPSFGLIVTGKASTRTIVPADIFYWWGGGTPGYWVNGSGTNYGSSWAVGDVIGMLVNRSTNTVTYYKNGVSQGVATSALPPGGYHVFARAAGTNNASTSTFAANFGSTPFAYPIVGATGITTS